MAKLRKILTPRFRVSYAHVFTPQQDDQGRDVYSVTMIFEDDDKLDDLKQLIKEAKQDKFGANAKGIFKPTLRRGVEATEEKPNGFDLEKNPEYKGKIIATARSYNLPVGISKVNRSVPAGDPKRIILITDRTEFYSGCYAIASLTAYAYDSDKNKGVALSLQNLIKVGDGEPLAKQRNAADDFKELGNEHFDEDDMDDDEDFDLD